MVIRKDLSWLTRFLSAGGTESANQVSSIVQPVCHVDLDNPWPFQLTENSQTPGVGGQTVNLISLPQTDHALVLGLYGETSGTGRTLQIALVNTQYIADEMLIYNGAAATSHVPASSVVRLYIPPGTILRFTWGTGGVGDTIESFAFLLRRSRDACLV